MDLQKLLKPLIIVVFVVIIIASVGWFIWSLQGRGVIRASGTIEATEIDVSSKIAGTVLELAVREGDKVNKGDLIAKLDIPELKAELKRAEAAVAAAQTKYRSTIDNFERAKELFAKAIISNQQYDEAKSAYEVAGALLNEAKAAKELVSTQVKNATITAPISGTIVLKTIEIGELVNPGMTIVTIADLSKVTLKVYLLEREVGRVKLGQPAFVSVDSYPREKFEGKITYISPQAEFTPKNIQTREERVTQVFAVKVEIPNPEEKLKPGLPADAEIRI